MPTTDHYTLCEDAVIALLRNRLPSSFITEKTKQIVPSDTSVLGLGFDYFVVAYPDDFPSTAFAAKIVQVEWNVLLDVFVRWKNNEAKSWERFKDFRAEVFQLFVSYRTLDKTPTVLETSLRSGGSPQYFNSKGSPDAGPVFISQRLTATVKQLVNRKGGEYPA